MSKIVNISTRHSGVVGDNGKVTIGKVLSYDIVSNPGFKMAGFWNIPETHTEKVKNIIGKCQKK